MNNCFILCSISNKTQTSWSRKIPYNFNILMCSNSLMLIFWIFDQNRWSYWLWHVNSLIYIRKSTFAHTLLRDLIFRFELFLGIFWWRWGNMKGRQGLFVGRSMIFYRWIYWIFNLCFYLLLWGNNSFFLFNLFQRSILNIIQHSTLWLFIKDLSS